MRNQFPLIILFIKRRAGKTIAHGKIAFSCVSADSYIARLMGIYLPYLSFHYGRERTLHRHALIIETAVYRRKSYFMFWIIDDIILGTHDSVFWLFGSGSFYLASCYRNQRHSIIINVLLAGFWIVGAEIIILGIPL